MAKKKYEYVNEHILTIENLRTLIGIFFVGVVILGICAFSWYSIFTGDCCIGPDDPCNFASGLGMVVWIIATIIFSILGLVCIFGVFIDKGGKEIKVRKEIA